MIDGIVEKQNLGRIDQHGQQRIQLVGQHPVDSVAYSFREPGHRVPYEQIAGYGQQHRYDAEGEVVHQHLEAGLDTPLDHLIPGLDI